MLFCLLRAGFHGHSEIVKHPLLVLSLYIAHSLNPLFAQDGFVRNVELFPQRSIDCWSHLHQQTPQATFGVIFLFQHFSSERGVKGGK